jgi:hypothetical protein
MNRREAEEQIYRTTTVEQLVAALVESRDQTDIRHIFEHHQGGTAGFKIACHRLGIPEKDWDYANNVAGFHALVGIIGDKRGLSRYDPAAEQARREKVTAVMKSPAVENLVNGQTEVYASQLSSDLAPAQVASLQKEAESLEASQRTLVASHSVENRYNEALAQQVRAKGEQIARLEDKLERLIEDTEASLTAGANAAPGTLVGAAARGEWEAQRRLQMQRLEHLEERLERVHEIRQESGLFATKIEELAEEKLRREEPVLARERDAALERHRYEKANERVLNNEPQRELGEELGRSLSES